MSDILRQVDEELRQDRLINLWRRYRVYLIGGLILLIGSVIGYQINKSVNQSFYEEEVEKYISTSDLANLNQTIENLGKIKLYTWKGFTDNSVSEKEEKGSGWILAEQWWPYQRPSFVTPPFAGYVSGHSTYSRAASVILEKITGSKFFPGGIGEFEISKNQEE